MGRRSPILYLLLAVAVLLALAVPVEAELRINDLDVFLNDFDVTVRVVALGAIPPGVLEGIQSGIPARIRFSIELYRYNRLWRDELIKGLVIERQVTYNVVSKEYKVTFMRDEGRPVYTSRDLRDAQRVASEVHAAKLVPAGSIDPTSIIYVRVRAETALNGENTFVARLAGTAEQTEFQSDYRTLMRVQ